MSWVLQLSVSICCMAAEETWGWGGDRAERPLLGGLMGVTWAST